MAKQSRRQSKYFAPQNENKHHICDHPGCNKAGEYRAPKDRNLKEYYWFCLEHVQEYNSKWNYYGDETFSEPEDELRRKFKFSSHIKYNFGFDFDGSYDFFERYSSSNNSRTFFTTDEKKALQLMGLDAETLTAENLKKAYKKAVKKYHPDINSTDSSAEENFKIVSICYKTLLAKVS
jgi:hypothetical protein